MSNKQQVQDRAEASFKKKEQRAQEGAKAYAEYQAEGIAIRKKTERLKALRLAKEAAEKDVPKVEKAPKEPKGKNKKKPSA